MKVDKELEHILTKLKIPFKESSEWVSDGHIDSQELFDELISLEIDDKYAPDMLAFFIYFVDLNKVKEMLKIQ